LDKLFIILNRAMKSSCSEILKKVSTFLDGSFYNNSHATHMLTQLCRFIYLHFSKKESSNSFYCPCDLVVRVLGYRSGGPGSIPGATRKKSNGSGTGSTQPCEYN
jgi:hypothetical protein